MEAYFILQENNPMSEICSTICPVEEQCVGHCIRGLKGTPIKINSLEKFVNIWAKENNVSYEIKKVQNINKKVAIIGAGPAGIACAIDLAKNGASVTIFEKESSLGGILEYGIPDFRLQKSILSKIANVMKGLGITIKTNITFGKDITLENLKEQGYSSVFLAMGAQKQTSYKLAEENVESVFNSDEFLKDYNLNHKKRNLGKVVVIGGERTIRARCDEFIMRTDASLYTYVCVDLLPYVWAYTLVCMRRCVLTCFIMPLSVTVSL